MDEVFNITLFWQVGGESIGIPLISDVTGWTAPTRAGPPSAPMAQI
jgi:hypothetical protein